jgi:hypothetical protein
MKTLVAVKVSLLTFAIVCFDLQLHKTEVAARCILGYFYLSIVLFSFILLFEILHVYL